MSLLRAVQRCRKVLRASPKRKRSETETKSQRSKAKKAKTQMAQSAQSAQSGRTLFVCAMTIRSNRTLKAVRDDQWSPEGRGFLARRFANI